jgi:hypothetical protein
MVQLQLYTRIRIHRMALNYGRTVATSHLACVIVYCGENIPTHLTLAFKLREVAFKHHETWNFNMLHILQTHTVLYW